DELAPFHSITSSASCRRCNGRSRPNAFAVLRLMTIKARRLHNGQVGGPLTLEYASNIDSCFSPDFGTIRAVTHQAASSDEFAPFVECRNPVMRRERNQSLADHLKKQRRPVENSSHLAFCHGSKRLIDFLFGADADNDQRLPD